MKHVAEGILIADVLGELSAAEAEEVRRHLADCADCREAQKSLAEIVAAARATSPGEEDERGLEELIARLDTCRADPVPSRSRPRSGVPLGLAAALALMLFASGYWTGQRVGGGPGTSSRTPPAVVGVLAARDSIPGFAVARAESIAPEALISRREL